MQYYTYICHYYNLNFNRDGRFKKSNFIRFLILFINRESLIVYTLYTHTASVKNN